MFNINIPEINFIADLLDAGETAVAVFTHGAEFHQNPDGTGHTGAWLFGANHIAQHHFLGVTVFIYLHGENQNTIFQSQCIGVEGPHLDDRGRARYYLLLENIETAGITQNNWFVCANTHRQDFAYFNILPG